MAKLISVYWKTLVSIANEKSVDNSYTILTDVDLLPSITFIDTYTSYPDNVII